MKKKDKLLFKNIELRSEEKDNSKYITGIIPYNSKSVSMWGMNEIIAPSAFNKTLQDRTTVRALVNHDDSKILGSTESGTLELSNTESGLVCTCKLPQTSYASDLFEIVNRGDCQTMSFGFLPIKFEDNMKNKTRTLKEVKLEEVSFAVLYPAYPETTSVTYMRGLEKNDIDIEKLNEVLEKEQLINDDKTIIQNTINVLSNLIKDEAVENEQVDTTQEQVNTPADTTMIELEIEAELTA